MVALDAIYVSAERSNSFSRSEKQKLLFSRVNKIKNWVRATCPNRDYLSGLKSSQYGVRVNDNAIILHMGQIPDSGISFEEAGNSFDQVHDRFNEDICVVVWNATPNDFDIVVPSFDDKETCDYFVQLQWPDSFGTDSVCENSDGGWGHYMRVKFH